MRIPILVLIGLLAFEPIIALSRQSAAMTGTPAETSSDKVIVSGTLPNEDMRAKVLARLRAVYGPDRVVDRIDIGPVVAPGNWDQYLSDMIDPNLKLISHGQIQVQGNEIRVSGEVPSEAQKQHVQNQLSGAFNGTYQLHSSLKVGTSQQKVLDDALAHRVVEFESGSAVLTLKGRAVLDEMAAAIARLQDPHIVIVGNTDSSGDRQANILLSLQRATAVRDYLAIKKIPASTMSVSGSGPDQPVADNTTAEGRARNRRIDFKIMQ